MTILPSGCPSPHQREIARIDPSCRRVAVVHHVLQDLARGIRADAQILLDPVEQICFRHVDGADRVLHARKIAVVERLHQQHSIDAQELRVGVSTQIDLAVGRYQGKIGSKLEISLFAHEWLGRFQIGRDYALRLILEQAQNLFRVVEVAEMMLRPEQLIIVDREKLPGDRFVREPNFDPSVLKRPVHRAGNIVRVIQILADHVIMRCEDEVLHHLPHVGFALDIRRGAISARDEAVREYGIAAVDITNLIDTLREGTDLVELRRETQRAGARPASGRKRVQRRIQLALEILHLPFQFLVHHRPASCWSRARFTCTQS